MFEREELHPQADMLRHAQLLAAVANGQLSRRDRKNWRPSDFLRANPWAPAQAPAAKRVPTPDELKAQVAAMNQARRKK